MAFSSRNIVLIMGKLCTAHLPGRPHLHRILGDSTGNGFMIAMIITCQNVT